MDCSPDHLRKRQLFEAWLSGHQAHATVLGTPGQLLEVKSAVQGVAALVAQQGSSAYVYLLMEQTGARPVPAYIGKSVNPVSRWTSHLRSLLAGKGSYAHWQARLLSDGQVRHLLKLYVIGQEQVLSPPIPGFPTAIGATEYQLIGLAQDAFATRLLNVEGQRR